MTTVSRVTLELGSDHRGALEVDGIDLSRYVNRVQIDVATGNLPEITLTLRPMSLTLAADAAALTIIQSHEKEKP